MPFLEKKKHKTLKWPVVDSGVIKNILNLVSINLMETEESKCSFCKGKTCNSSLESYLENLLEFLLLLLILFLDKTNAKHLLIQILIRFYII